MNTGLKDSHIEIIKNAKFVTTDLSDNLVKNKVVYSSFDFIGKKMKKRKYFDAIKLTVNGIKILLSTSFKKRFDYWETENQALKNLYKCLSKYNIEKEDVEEVAKKYIKRNEIAGAKSCLEKIRKIGNNKKLILLTREPSDYANVAKNYFCLDSYICNISKYNGNKISDIEIIIKKPEDKLKLLEKEFLKENEDLKNSIMITNNIEDYYIFKGKVGLLISSPKSSRKLRKNSDLHINDYREFEKQLINSC